MCWKFIKSSFFLAVALMVVGVALATEETLTNEDVVSMFKANLARELIVEKIKSSDNTFDMSTKAMITLKEGGVPDEVITLMLHEVMSKKSRIKSKTSLEIQNLASKRPEVRDAAFLYLRRMGSTVVPQLRDTLTHTRPEMRIAAARALARFGDRKSLEVIRAMLTDSVPEVRYAAADSLAILKDTAAVEVARKSVVGGEGLLDGYIRLLGLARDLKSVGFIKLRLLEDMQPLTRAQAAWALGAIGSEQGREALEHAIAKDREDIVRSKAAEALGRIKNAESLPLLLRVCKTDPAARKDIILALGNFPPEKVVPFIIDILGRNINAAEQEACLTSLRKLTHQDFGDDVGKWRDWWEKKSGNTLGKSPDSMIPSAPGKSNNSDMASGRPQPPPPVIQKEPWELVADTSELVVEDEGENEYSKKEKSLPDNSKIQKAVQNLTENKTVNFQNDESKPTERVEGLPPLPPAGRSKPIDFVEKGKHDVTDAPIGATETKSKTARTDDVVEVKSVDSPKKDSESVATAPEKSGNNTWAVDPPGMVVFGPGGSIRTTGVAEAVDLDRKERKVSKAPVSIPTLPPAPKPKKRVQPVSAPIAEKKPEQKDIAKAAVKASKALDMELEVPGIVTLVSEPSEQSEAVSTTIATKQGRKAVTSEPSKPDSAKTSNRKTRLFRFRRSADKTPENKKLAKANEKKVAVASETKKNKAEKKDKPVRPQPEKKKLVRKTSVASSRKRSKGSWLGEKPKSSVVKSEDKGLKFADMKLNGKKTPKAAGAKKTKIAAVAVAKADKKQPQKKSRRTIFFRRKKDTPAKKKTKSPETVIAKADTSTEKGKLNNATSRKKENVKKPVERVRARETTQRKKPKAVASKTVNAKDKKKTPPASKRDIIVAAKKADKPHDDATVEKGRPTRLWREFKKVVSEKKEPAKKVENIFSTDPYYND